MRNLELYRVFYVTALEKSFSKAAQKLYITQPSVSQSIKQLEESLDVPLFIRTSRGVEITHEGEILFHFIKQAFLFVEQGEQRLAELKNMEHGEVAIGGSDSLCKHYLLPHMQSFQVRFPDVRLKLQHGSTPLIIEKLMNSEIDLGLVHLPVKETQIQIFEFLTLHSTFIVGPRWRKLSEKGISLEELLHYPIISFSEHSSSRKFLSDLFLSEGLSFKPEIEVGSVDLLMECAEKGLGIAFITKEFVSKELSRKQLFEVPLEMEIPLRQVGIATRKDAPLSIAARRFIDQLLSKI